MKVLLSAMVLTCTALPAFADDDDPVAAEWEKLQGEWKAVAAEIQGQEVDDADVPEITFEIAQAGRVTATTPDGDAEATMTIDLEHDPHRFDVEHTGGVFDNQRQYGIYRWDDEKLVMCICSPGGTTQDRPQRFETRNTMSLMITFEKQ